MSNGPESQSFPGPGILNLDDLVGGNEPPMERLLAMQDRMLMNQQIHFETALSNERAHNEALRAELVRGHRNALTADHLAALGHSDQNKGPLEELVDQLLPLLIDRLKQELG